jgi:hypothetical protein
MIVTTTMARKITSPSPTMNTSDQSHSVEAS